MGFKWKINGGALVDDIHDTGSDNFYIATGLDPDTNYCAQVEAYDGSLESGYGSSVCATTTGDPPVPNNLALASNGGTFSAQSELDPVNNPIGAMFDGLRTGGTGIFGGENYASANDPALTAQWVDRDFGTPKSFSQIDIIGMPSGFGGAEPVLQQGGSAYAFSDFKVQYWNGSAWVDINSWSSNTDTWRTVFFSPITAQRIRLFVTNAPSSAGGRVYGTEFEIWETAKNPVNIIADGNSRSQNTDYSWTRKLQRLLNHNYSVQSMAIGGRDMNDMVTDGDISRLTALYNPNASDNVVVMLDSINDWGHSRSLAAVQADTITWATAARAAGFKVILGTTAKATSSFVSGSNETNRAAFNTWLLTNPSSIADAIIDVAAQTEFTDPDTSVGYFTDHIHFSDTGGTVIGGLIAAVLDPWYTF